MNDIFKLRENMYNLRNFHIFQTENPRSLKYGLDAIPYRASQLWNFYSKLLRKTKKGYFPKVNPKTFGFGKFNTFGEPLNCIFQTKAACLTK